MNERSQPPPLADARAAVVRLPWWTWILPALVCHVGTQVSLLSSVAPGVSAVYLPIPLGLAMVCWWGPRALLGLYVNAVLSAGLWGLSAWHCWPLYAMPETAAVLVGWWLFTRVGRGRCWLPDVGHLMRFLRFAVVPAALLNGFYVSVQLLLLGDLDPAQFWRLSWSGCIATLLDGLAVASPLLLFATGAMERRGLSRTNGAAAAADLDRARLPAVHQLEIVVAFGAVFAASRVLTFELFLSVCGVFVVWMALRFGVHVAVLGNLWLEFAVMAMPLSPVAGQQPTATLQNLQLALATLVLAGLVIGRVISDVRTEIAQRRRSEDALRTGEARFRTFVDQATDAFFLLDGHGRILDVNTRACESFRCTRDELIGQPLRLVDREPSPSGAHGEPLHARIEAGETVALDRWLTRHDGTRFPVEVRARPFEDGGRRFVVALVRDITARKEAEEAMREQGARLRAILESSVDGLIVIDATGRVCEFNAAAERLFGHPRDRVIGKRVGDLLVPPRLRDAHAKGLARFVATREPHILGKLVELPAVRADGSEFRAEISIAQVAGVEPPLFAGVVRDLTERKQLEEQLRQSQKMEAIGQLAGGIAHDFNNLLTVISGYSEQLLRSLPAGDPDLEAAKAIQDAGVRAAALTRQLLAFSRRAVVAPRVLRLNAVMTEMDRMMRRVIGENILLRLDLDPQAGSVRVDSGQLSQVVLNLAVNARDAMPRGGRLVIATRSVEIAQPVAAAGSGGPPLPPGRYARLTVRDTGTGMTPDVKARVFEPFFTTKGIGQGTGLGLAVVHGIVRQAGGHIEVDSEWGRGTCFTIHLPQAVEDPDELVTPADALVGGDETVLFVEDDASVSKLTTAMLRWLGYTVITAPDGRAAIRQIEAEALRFDLLITDVVMPHMGGRELAQHLRARDAGLRVLFLSGYTDDEVLRSGAGRVEELLQKPFSMAELAKAVRMALDSRGVQRIGS